MAQFTQNRKEPIQAICDLTNLNDDQLISVGKHFLGNKFSDKLSKDSLLGELILHPTINKIIVKNNPKSVKVCFNNNDKYVALLKEVNSNKASYDIIVPNQFIHKSFNKFQDRINIVIQLGKFNVCSTTSLHWQELLLPQMWSVAQYYGVELSQPQGIDPPNKIRAKIIKCKRFKENYSNLTKRNNGNSAMNMLMFSFHIDSPYEWIGTSTDENVADETDSLSYIKDVIPDTAEDADGNLDTNVLK